MPKGIYKNKKGETAHHFWKGNNAKPRAVHRWIERWKGKPNECEMCGKTEGKRFEWANIDHKYRRVLDDFIRMCTSCHRNYDIKNNNWKGGKKLSNRRRKSSRRNLGHIFLNTCDISDWVGHHLDLNYVVFIPEKLHKSIYHSVTKNRNMDLINDKVYEWFMGYYLGKP